MWRIVLIQCAPILPCYLHNFSIPFFLPSKSEATDSTTHFLVLPFAHIALRTALSTLFVNSLLSVTFGRFMSPNVMFTSPPLYWLFSIMDVGMGRVMGVAVWGGMPGNPNFSIRNSVGICEISHSRFDISSVNTMSPWPTLVSVPSFLLKWSSSPFSPRKAGWS